MGIGDTVCGVNQVLQLLTGGCRMGNEDRDKKHLFIVVLQILQKLLGFLTEGHKVGRQNVHIKAGTNRSFLLVDFCLVQIAQFPFHGFQRSALVKRLCVDADDLAAFDIKKCVQQRVIQFGGLDLQKGNRADRRANAEIPALLK